MACVRSSRHEEFVFVDGSVYSGEWVAGEPEGQGKMTWPASKAECDAPPDLRAKHTFNHPTPNTRPIVSARARVD